MARIYRFPLTIIKDSSKCYTVKMLDDTTAIAVSNSRRDAIQQIKDYLHYVSKENVEPIPDFLKPRITNIKVKVFAEYKDEKRTYAVRNPIHLKVPTILGTRQSGLQTAYLPITDTSFDYHDDDTLEELGQHYVKSFFKGMTPQEISRFLAPESVEIEEISISLKEPSERYRESSFNLENVSKIADYIGAKNYRKNSRVWEREDYLASLEQKFRNLKGGLCIVGSTGSGKSSLIIEAARRVELQQKKLGKSQKQKQLFWMSNGSRIISGMVYLGQWQERLEKAIEELANNGAILCFESLYELLQMGGESTTSSVAAFLLPYIQNEEIRIVIEATPEEVEACDRVLPGLIDLLQQVKLEDFTEPQSLRILEKYTESAVQQDKITFNPETTQIIFQLFKRFLPYTAFPGRVIQFMDHLRDQALLSTNRVIDKEVAWLLFSQQTGITLDILQQSSAYTPNTLTKKISSQVVGQAHAVEMMTNTIVKFKSGLNDPNRPLGVFLCCGPTGVGKTAMAKALGNILFGEKPEKDRLIRLDMSEYAGYDASVRLLGLPNGQPSDLIKKMRANPFTILLLDEVEKACDEVFDILLNVFDEGRLTDAHGRVTYFNSSIILMTSNLGAGLSQSVGFETGNDELNSVDASVVKKFFRPEFFNRLDSVIYFNGLSKGVVKQIATKEINDLVNREGFTDRNIKLNVAEEVIQKVADHGFDPKYGARPLQRSIENEIITPLANYLVTHPQERETTLHLRLERGKLEIQK